MIPQFDLYVEQTVTLPGGETANRFASVKARIAAKSRHLLVAKYLQKRPAIAGAFLKYRARYEDVLTAAMAEERHQMGDL